MIRVDIGRTIKQSKNKLLLKSIALQGGSKKLTFLSKFLNSSVKLLLISVNKADSSIFHENGVENNDIRLKLRRLKKIIMNFIFVHEYVNGHWVVRFFFFFFTFDKSKAINLK